MNEATCLSRSEQAAALAEGNRSLQLELSIGTNGGPFVVTFSNWHPVGTAHRPFAKGTLSRLGINAAHIVSDRSEWYCGDQQAISSIFNQIGELPEYRAASERIGFGSSMGGHGALKFRHVMKFDRVIAVCPQFSISPTRAPFETRWREEAQSCDFSADQMDTVAHGEDVMLIYDPLISLDRMQAETIDPDRHARHRKLPLFGHPPLTMLAELALFDQFVVELIKNNEKLDSLSQAWTVRRSAASFWERVARHFGTQPKTQRHFRISDWAVQRGLALEPDRAGLLMAKGHLDRIRSLHQTC